MQHSPMPAKRTFHVVLWSQSTAGLNPPGCVTGVIRQTTRALAPGGRVLQTDSFHAWQTPYIQSAGRVLPRAAILTFVLPFIL